MSTQEAPATIDWLVEAAHDIARQNLTDHYGDGARAALAEDVMRSYRAWCWVTGQAVERMDSWVGWRQALGSPVIGR